MSTRRTRTFAAFLTASALVTSIGGLSAAALTSLPAPAAVQQTCWDFATLDQSHIYRIGDVFRAPTATIEMKNYLWNGNKSTNDSAQAYATQGQISGGPAPEFRLYLINAHVEPDTPANTVSYRFGHFVNGKSGVAHANLGVNGELVEVTAGMASLNDIVLGDPAVGRVRVTVTMTTLPGDSPERGTVLLTAETGSIEKFTIGGIQKFVDDLCFQ
jgi:hypothetical protein